ncbi:MAG: hypothetical protein HYZ57_16950 [Acidobacteria bacterium]|nr:hypothetical protein [Acidobacteriota bacterium]MBI3281518.1 hypothetical protein [Acidobacteriota bacterium]
MHAGSFLLKRRIVLESRLLSTPRRLARILIHEVAHFIWWRLGNPKRRAYEELLGTELEGGARGELGWSSDRLKRKLSPADRRRRSRRWREYVCESFCDTVAWRYSRTGSYAEMTLSRRYRDRRRRWVEMKLGAGPLAV